MAQHADFSNRRLKVQWEVKAEGSGSVLRARTPRSLLGQMTWLLPVQRYGMPRVVEGRALVVRDGAYWRVTAEGVPALRLALPAAPEPMDDMGPVAFTGAPRKVVR